MILSELLGAPEPTLVERVGAWCLVGSLPAADDGGWSFRTDVQIPAGPTTRVGLGDQVFPLRKRGGQKAFVDVILLGRAVSNDVIIPHESVSKLHARCEVQADGVKVSDANSSNGTRCGPFVVGAEGVVLVDGGDVVFGSCPFVLLSCLGVLRVLAKIHR